MNLWNAPSPQYVPVQRDTLLELRKIMERGVPCGERIPRVVLKLIADLLRDANLNRKEERDECSR